MRQIGDATKALTQLYGKMAKGAHVKVGVLEGAHQAPPHDPTAAPITMAELAAIHEFGAPNALHPIPERSFIRAGINENIERLKALARKVAPGPGRPPPEVGLGLIGEMAKAAVQRKFGDGTHVPDAPSTIAAKGSSVPLMDTGQLRASITYEVVVGGETSRGPT